VEESDVCASYCHPQGIPTPYGAVGEVYAWRSELRGDKGKGEREKRDMKKTRGDRSAGK